MKYRLRNITRDVFFKSFYSYEQQMLERLQGKDDFDVKEYTDKIIEEIKNFLQQYIGVEEDELINWLDVYFPIIYDNFCSLYSDNYPPKLEKEVARLERFYKSFSKLGKYLTIIDNFEDSLTKREKMSISEKKDFILSKLNTLHSDVFSLSKKFLRLII